MGMPSVNLAAKLALIAEHWSPRTVAAVNDYDVRLVKVLGEFTRHQHADTDEFFLVLDGELTIRLDDGDVTAALYTFLEQAKRRTENGLKPFDPTRAKIENILHALKAHVHLNSRVTPPYWLRPTPCPQPCPQKRTEPAGAAAGQVAP